MRVWLSPDRPLSVIVTGGSKGLGKALARDFLHYGDKVLITSRTQAGLSDALTELRREVCTCSRHLTHSDLYSLLALEI